MFSTMSGIGSSRVLLRIQRCFSACSGVKRFRGSTTRRLRTKSLASCRWAGGALTLHILPQAQIILTPNNRPPPCANKKFWCKTAGKNFGSEKPKIAFLHTFFFWKNWPKHAPKKSILSGTSHQRTCSMAGGSAHGPIKNSTAKNCKKKHTKNGRKNHFNEK